MNRRSWLAIILLTLLGLSQATGSAADNLPGKASGPDLEVGLRLDKAKFEAAEPIPVALEIINHGESDYYIQTSTEVSGQWDGFTFVVTTAGGESLPPARTLPSEGNWIGSWLQIAPHEKFDRKLFLNYFIMPPLPGKYRLQAVYTPRTAGLHPTEWPAVRTEFAEFEILPTTQTKLEVRITRLTGQAERGDPVAVDFLGFTGSSEAIEPLLRALYSDEPRLPRRAANALNLLLDEAAALEAALAKVREEGPSEMMVRWLEFRKAPGEKLLPLYLRAIESADANSRFGAALGLRLMTENAGRSSAFRRQLRPAMLMALNDVDSRVRAEAVRALAADADNESLAALAATARNDTSSRVRILASYCLSEIRTEAVVPHVRELLLADFRLRPNFAEQLRVIGTPSARAVLRDGLKSINPRVRTECAKQLWMLKDKSGRQTLLEVLRGAEVESQGEIIAFLREAHPRTRIGPADDTAIAKQWADWLEKQ